MDIWNKPEVDYSAEIGGGHNVGDSDGLGAMRGCFSSMAIMLIVIGAVCFCFAMGWL